MLLVPRPGGQPSALTGLVNSKCALVPWGPPAKAQALQTTPALLSHPVTVSAMDPASSWHRCCCRHSSSSPFPVIWGGHAGERLLSREGQEKGCAWGSGQGGPADRPG